MRPTAKRAMRLQVDKQADALYLRLDDADIVESVAIAPGVVLDHNRAAEVVGIEMLHLSARLPDLDLSVVQLEVV